VPLITEPAVQLIELIDVLAESALLQRGEALISGGQRQPINDVLERVNKALVRLSEGSELPLNVGGNAGGGSLFVVHRMCESESLPQGVVLLRDYQQREGLLEEAVSQLLGFARSDADERAVLHILELSQDVRAQGLNIAGDQWSERCDPLPESVRAALTDWAGAPNAIWALHLAAAVGDDAAFEAAREHLNGMGGVNERMVLLPEALYDTSGDETWPEELLERQMLVPPRSDFVDQVRASVPPDTQPSVVHAALRFLADDRYGSQPPLELIAGLAAG
jgi:hypothetical protein